MWKTLFNLVLRATINTFASEVVKATADEDKQGKKHRKADEKLTAAEERADDKARNDKAKAASKAQAEKSKAKLAQAAAKVTKEQASIQLAKLLDFQGSKDSKTSTQANQ